MNIALREITFKKLYVQRGVKHIRMTITEFNKLAIKTWNGNRTPDSMRIQSIKEAFEKGDYVSFDFWLANTEEGIICFDGNHRRIALVGIESKETVQIRWLIDGSEENIQRMFISLNNCVPVSEVYKDEEVKLSTRKAYEAIVEDYSLSFPKMLSGSVAPHRPHFNKQNFVDDIYNINKKYNLSPAVLKRVLSKLNEIYKDDTSLLLKKNENVREKACENKLWLFAVERRLCSKDFEKAMQACNVQPNLL